MRYKLSSLAQEHVLHIKSYSISHFSELQWLKYKESLLNGFQVLADNPDIGIKCEDIAPNGFYFPIAQHMAYFTKEPDHIVIVALLGKTQLPERHLKAYGENKKGE